MTKQKLIIIGLISLSVLCIAVLGLVDFSKYGEPQRTETKNMFEQNATGIPALDDMDTDISKRQNKAERRLGNQTRKVFNAQPGVEDDTTFEDVEGFDKKSIPSFEKEKPERFASDENVITPEPFKNLAKVEQQHHISADGKLMATGSKVQNQETFFQPKKRIHGSLQNVTSWVTSNGFNVILTADGSIDKYKAFFLKQPPRLVIDLIGKWEIPDENN